MSRAWRSAIYLAGTLAIIVLIASVVLVSIGPMSDGCSNENHARALIGELEEAVRTYHVTVGSYPPNLDALQVEPVGLPPGKWDGPYLNKDMHLDPWGHPYRFSLPGKHNSDHFDVWTVTPDGQEIGNW